MNTIPFSQATFSLRSLMLLVLALCCLPSQLMAQDEEFFGQEFGGGFEVAQEDEPVSLTAYYKVTADGKFGKLYVEAEIAPDWHLYSVTQPPGGPIRSVMLIPENEKFKLIGPWTPDHDPHVYEDDSFDPPATVEDHEEFVVWSAPIEFGEGVDTENLDMEIKFEGQTCITGGTCNQLFFDLKLNYKGEETGEIVRGELIKEIEEAPSTASVDHIDTPEEIAAMAELYDGSVPINYVKLDGSSGQGTFWAALIGAFLGGMILNLMPCVFPVLGLKVLSFVEQAGSDPKKIKMHGLAFAFGLIFSMWCLAGFILILKWSLGQEVSWGQQMGNPYFVGGIVILLFVLGLNLAGVFEMGLFMTKVGGGEKKKGYTGSFVSGVITTLVATPCSGPFLGAAMGYTLEQPPLLAMFLFTVFGLGIAFPYLILAFFPALIKMLPRPGAWMETFKKLMAFSLFAAAAFFIQAFGSQTGADGLSWLLMSICVISLALFFYGKFSPAYVKANTRKIWGWVAPILIGGVGIWMFYDAANMRGPVATAAEGWELWVPGKVETKLAANKPVWVDYTADW